jgi:hypothetical protein
MMSALLALALQLADPPRPWRQVEISLGGYLAGIDSELSAQSRSGFGSVIDFEDLLGLDNDDLGLRLGASVAVAERHRIHLDVFDLTRSASKVLEQTIEFEDTTYTVGTDVDTRLGIQFFNLTYGYSFLLDDRSNLALTFGIHGLRTSARLDSKGLGIRESERFFLPIPLPGLRMDFALTPDLWLRQRFEFLWLQLSDYEGLVTDGAIGLEWAFVDHVALGLEYNVVRSKLRMKNDDFPSVKFRGEFDFDFAGLHLYLNFYF